MTDLSHRGTIHLEDAEILSNAAYPGDQYIIRLQAPKCAAKAQPGSFVHIRCDPMLNLRRPLSIMRVSADAGWVEVLYKVLGEGTRLLAQRKPGETTNLMGPIGVPFRLDQSRPRALLMGGGVGIPPMVFIADAMRQDPNSKPLVLMGSEVPFPFQARPSEIVVPGLQDGVIAAMPLMEDWGVPSRLASLQGYPGVHDGYITDLARDWLKALSDEQRAQVSVYACGPHPMLEATAKLAREFNLPCQVSLEEFMACAVGGCAGCVVEVRDGDQTAMKRVCVDGPVFDAEKVFF